MLDSAARLFSYDAHVFGMDAAQWIIVFGFIRSKIALAAFAFVKSQL